MPALLLLAAAATAIPGWAQAYVERTLHATDYRSASVDLDGDGRPEVLVYARDPDRCGSGGCNLFVLARRSGQARVIARISITRPPIRVLRTRSHGWRDLGVLVAGGGAIPGYTARLRFDGGRYPENPTVPPAEPLRHPTGRIVLDSLQLLPSQLPVR